MIQKGDTVQCKGIGYPHWKNEIFTCEVVFDNGTIGLNNKIRVDASDFDKVRLKEPLLIFGELNKNHRTYKGSIQSNVFDSLRTRTFQGVISSHLAEPFIIPLEFVAFSVSNFCITPNALYGDVRYTKDIYDENTVIRPVMVGETKSNGKTVVEQCSHFVMLRVCDDAFDGMSASHKEDMKMNVFEYIKQFIGMYSEWSCISRQMILSGFDKKKVSTNTIDTYRTLFTGAGYLRKVDMAPGNYTVERIPDASLTLSELKKEYKEINYNINRVPNDGE